MKIKDKTYLVDLLHHEGYDVIAFWSDGRWSSVGSGYGGEQDSNDPVFCFSRAYFYDQPRSRCRLMLKAIEAALQNGSDYEDEYCQLGGKY